MFSKRYDICKACKFHIVKEEKIFCAARDYRTHPFNCIIGINKEFGEYCCDNPADPIKCSNEFRCGDECPSTMCEGEDPCPANVMGAYTFFCSVTNITKQVWECV